MLLISVSVAGQTSDELNGWMKRLSEKHGPSLAGIGEMMQVLQQGDSNKASNMIEALLRRGGDNAYLAARVNYLKAGWVWKINPVQAVDSAGQLIREALRSAFETDDDSLAAAIAWAYGSEMYYRGQMEPSATYCLYAAETYDAIGKGMSADQYRLLGDVLYATHDFQRSIRYTLLAVGLDRGDSPEVENRNMSRFNTIGLCWQKLGRLDSASYYLDRALEMAASLNNRIWQSIISGNRGQIYFAMGDYSRAKELLEGDYRFCKAYGSEFGTAANSLQWVARINLIQGKPDTALRQVREAIDLLSRDPKAAYLQNIFFAAAEVFRALGKADSASRYFQFYSHLHDSIERAAAVSGLQIARIRLADLQNETAIRNLHKEKAAEELKRNFLVFAIILIAVIALLVLNRQRQQAMHQQQLASAEMAAAREQVDSFRRRVVENTDLIEKLRQQVEDRQTTAQQAIIVSELSQQTILTEEDWEKFKRMFEKAYPGFFRMIKEKAPDITIAEQRMAALTRLQLTARQMASMLGISVDSVHKTRQRLRQRLQAGEASLDEIIHSL